MIILDELPTRKPLRLTLALTKLACLPVVRRPWAARTPDPFRLVQRPAKFHNPLSNLSPTTSMPPATALNADECQAVLSRWAANGPTDEERDEFLRTALSLFADDELVDTLVENISDMAQSAANIDKTFEEVERILWLVVWVIWPIGIPLLSEWSGYKTVSVPSLTCCPLLRPSLLALEECSQDFDRNGVGYCRRSQECVVSIYSRSVICDGAQDSTKFTSQRWNPFKRSRIASRP